MATLTVTIPDNKYMQLQAAAARKHRPVEDLLLDAIDYLTSPNDSQPASPLTREEEQRIIREAMQGRIWTTDDIEAFFDGLGLPEMSDEEAERTVAAIPPLDPPLSQTVIQMRDEERY